MYSNQHFRHLCILSFDPGASPAPGFSTRPYTLQFWHNSRTYTNLFRSCSCCFSNAESLLSLVITSHACSQDHLMLIGWATVCLATSTYREPGLSSCHARWAGCSWISCTDVSEVSVFHPVLGEKWNNFKKIHKSSICISSYIYCMCSESQDALSQPHGASMRITNSSATCETARKLLEGVTRYTVNTLSTSWTLYSQTRMTYHPHGPHTGIKTQHKSLSSGHIWHFKTFA